MVNPNYKEINAKKQVDDPESVFNYYRKLIALRKEKEIIVYGTYDLLLPVELYMEGQRWFDLVRNNRLLEVMQKHKDKDGRLLFAGLQAFRQLWPIPQGEKDKNTNLTQNEGY